MKTDGIQNTFCKLKNVILPLDYGIISKGARTLIILCGVFIFFAWRNEICRSIRL